MEVRTLGTLSFIERFPNNIVVRYWDTIVATLCGKVIEINMGGFDTLSTKDAINFMFKFTRANISMVRKDWEYRLITERGDVLAAVDPNVKTYFNIETGKIVNGFDSSPVQRKRSAKRSEEENDPDYIP
ncbi:MAG TPA: hypothetical protein VJ508_16045 [Saprospiraceae bacterium]|nr:hypothetical protein [Saprospiraceae bacterium]